jgi:uncharacterized protein
MAPIPFRHSAPCKRLGLGLGALLSLSLAGSLAAQAGEQASFVLRVQADTFAVESFTRTADRLEGVLAGAAIGRIAYTLTLGEADATPALHLRAWAPGADPATAPMQEARITMRGDSSVAEITTSAGTRTERLGTRAGAVLYLNPSMAHIEQLVRRARALDGDRAEIPVLMVQGGQTVTATVTRQGADSVLVAIGALELHLAVSPEGRVLGGAIPLQNLTFSRVDHALPTTVAASAPPDYSAPEGAPYTAEEVTVPTPAGHRLVGTLTRPRQRGRVPAVVMITGSGAQDRDQAIGILPGYRPFRDIADTLSRRGIAVLRLDDRGTGASTGDFAAATSADFADDIRAALAYLRTRTDIDPRRLGLVGHSEGGVIAPMVAATDPSLRAIVLIAGTARTGREIIAFQQRQAVDTNPMIAPESRDSIFAAMQEQFYAGSAQQPWLRFFLDHDPLPVARQVSRTPVLIVHGETDRQVTVDQAETLAAAFREAGNRDVTVRTFADVNHLLLHDPDGNPAGYMGLAGRQVVPDVRGALAEWLAQRLR